MGYNKRKQKTSASQPPHFKSDPVTLPAPQSAKAKHYRNIGNQAVQRMIQSGAIQAKLKIGQPKDKYEQEADRAAEQVMNMPDQAVQLKTGCPDCPAEEENETPIQTKMADNQSPQLSPGVEHQVQSIKREGQPVPEPTRSFFEQRFQQDFSAVRVHTDAAAAETADLVNARAFTWGQDVVFAAGEYAPNTAKGRDLLAHEFTHVLQQRHKNDTDRSVIRTRGPADPFPDGTAYLKHLREKKVIKGDAASRKTAAKLVNQYWIKGSALFILSHTLKALIIEELMNLLNTQKSLPKNYQEAIALLIEGMGKAELELIFSRVSKKEIKTGMSKSREERIEAHEKSVAAAKKPGVGVFDPDKVLKLRDSFLENAQLSDSKRKVCIEILEKQLQKVYKGDKGESDVSKALKASAKKTKVKTVWLGAHSVDNLMHHLSKSKVVVDKFETDYGRVSDPSKKRPKIPGAKMKKSAWKNIETMVGNEHGWHLFIMSIMHGYHSATLFVEKRPKGMFLYLADQNWTGLVDLVEKGSMAGFKRYHGETGFNAYLNKATHIFWDDVYTEIEDDLKSKNAKISKDDIYKKANRKTKLTIWKLGRKTGGSPMSLKGLPSGKTKTAAPAAAGKTWDYTIRKDDNLWNLAKRYGTTVSKLRELNGMSESESTVHPGKKLKIPVNADIYIFKDGDTLDKIAKKHDTTKEKLMKLNGFKESDLSAIKPQDPIRLR